MKVTISHARVNNWQDIAKDLTDPILDIVAPNRPGGPKNPKGPGNKKPGGGGWTLPIPPGWLPPGVTIGPGGIQGKGRHCDWSLKPYSKCNKTSGECGVTLEVDIK